MIDFITFLANTVSNNRLTYSFTSGEKTPPYRESQGISGAGFLQAILFLMK